MYRCSSGRGSDDGKEERRIREEVEGGERDPHKRRPMGEAVGRRADIVWVTTDNPRREDPKSIAREVAAGCRRGGRALVYLEPDRAEAVRQAVDRARPGDVVLVAGTGHERGQTIGTRTVPFSDAEAAVNALNQREKPGIA